ncbi:unnamed protein product [Parnassius apollo]|uniref:(apollo) hypothetical protein n=1 Tax=Parnassius apollo TaxID=110799 RepID=A0A8S3Y5C5_PARAO|nr:unnamed protein product [Parnassius apollo]
MSGGRSIDKERKSPRESGEDSEDESEILEESPCGRWLKRREESEHSHFISEYPDSMYFWLIIFRFGNEESALMYVAEMIWFLFRPKAVSE